jgi:hypothetical protein
MAGAVQGQELLLNPSFADPAITLCEESFADIEHWEFNINEGDRRNGDYLGPACPGTGDGIHASMQGWGGGGTMTGYMYQTVSVTGGQPLRLSGEWWFGNDPDGVNGNLTVSAEIRAGSSVLGSEIATTQQVIQNGTTGQWIQFCICGTPSAGVTEVTVVLRAVKTGFFGWGLHVDNVSLVNVASCGGSNELTSIDTTYGVRDTVLDDVALAGTGFIAGTTTVKLTKEGESDIVATDVQVIDTNNLTCDFDLTGAKNGRWNVVADFGPLGCPAQTALPGALLVVLDALSNGSFELPTAPGACPAVPISGIPTDWLVSALGSWGDAGYDDTTIYRDSDISPPTCPPPDQDHYASTYSIPPDPNAQPESHAYQTIKVDNTQMYTISGRFAGAGTNTVVLELLDGDELAPVMDGGAIIHDEGPAYDWTFAYAVGQPTGDLLTVRWRVTTRSEGPHVAHADDLKLEVCSAAVVVSTVSPDQALISDGIASLVISGSGFSGTSTPEVMLARSGQVPVNATNIQVISDTEIHCDADLSNVPSGMYDLVVFKDGCGATLPDGLTVQSTTLSNGSFELPDPGVPPSCSEGDPVILGVPDGWSTLLNNGGRLDRDHDVFRPVTCPSTDGGHFGSLTIDRSGDLVAYQTLRVTPTAQYTLSGLFAGGGPSSDTATIELIDGSLGGTVLATTQVNDLAGGAAYDWRTRSVTAEAISDTLVIAWRFLTVDDGSNAVRSSHADGLTFEQTGSPCGDPFVDADNDGDVDQTDLGMFQICFTGPNAGPFPAVPSYCRCLDLEPQGGDGDIDVGDYAVLEACASGPGVPADTTCDD